MSSCAPSSSIGLKLGISARPPKKVTRSQVCQDNQKYPQYCSARRGGMFFDQGEALFSNIHLAVFRGFRGFLVLLEFFQESPRKTETKERPVHELSAGAFRNKSSM